MEHEKEREELNIRQRGEDSAEDSSSDQKGGDSALPVNSCIDHTTAEAIHDSRQQQPGQDYYLDDRIAPILNLGFVMSCPHELTGNLNINSLALMALIMTGVCSLGWYMSGNDAVSYLVSASVVYSALLYIRTFRLIALCKGKVDLDDLIADNPSKVVMEYAGFIVTLLLLWLFLKITTLSQFIDSTFVYGAMGILSISALQLFANWRVGINAGCCVKNQKHVAKRDIYFPIAIEFIFIIALIWSAIGKAKGIF